MEDAIETLLGLEIVDESDAHIDMGAELARKRWEDRARAMGIVPDGKAIEAEEKVRINNGKEDRRFLSAQAIHFKNRHPVRSHGHHNRCHSICTDRLV